MASPDLVARWFALTRTELPGLAAERGWPIHLDHCFQRVLLDNAVGAPWRTAIPSPAWRNADDATLRRAIELGEETAAGEADLAALNRHSLLLGGTLR